MSDSPTIIKDFPGRAVELHLREKGCLPGEECFTGLDSPALLSRLGDDAHAWATAFCQHARLQGITLDRDWLIGWFANAIEHSYDVRIGRGKVRQ